MSRCFAINSDDKFKPKRNYQRQAFEHLKGNKLFIKVTVEVNRTLQHEDCSSICRKLQ